jgi:hypothetical protein
MLDTFSAHHHDHCLVNESPNYTVFPDFVFYPASQLADSLQCLMHQGTQAGWDKMLTDHGTII